MRKSIINTPHVISTKASGSMKKNDGSINLKNIKKFLIENDLPERFVCMHQIHSGNVGVVQDTKREIISEVDCLVTNRKNVSLGVITADCLPVLFYDKNNNVIAAAHAGSKGLLYKILQNTVEILRTKFNSNPKDIVVLIGPGIEKKCYEVGEEVISQFTKQYHWFDTSYYSDSKSDFYFLDLRKIAQQILIKEGILLEHIEISELCTKCEIDTFYSYRRGDTNGRIVSVISL